MPFDHVNLRFQLIRWTAIVLAILLPGVTWFIARDYFDLGHLASIEITLVVTIIVFVVLRLVANYLLDGFARSYVSSGWDYLYARFGVDATPLRPEHDDMQTGYGQLDRDDVVFEAESSISGDGIYVNFMALGRLFLPWDAISVLQKRTLLAHDKMYDAAAIVLDGPASDICVPWSDAFDDRVPASVGVS